MQSLLGMGWGTLESRRSQMVQPHLYCLLLTVYKANFSLSHTQVFTGKAVVGVVQNKAGK